MLPIRCVSPRLAYPVAGLALIALIAGSVGGSPLPSSGVDTIQRLLKRSRTQYEPIPSLYPEERAALSVSQREAIEDLVRFRKQLREAADRLPSLGEVSRVLLLPEWQTNIRDIDSAVMSERADEAVSKPGDDEFARALASLMNGKAPKEDDESGGLSTSSIATATASAIKREVRTKLLNRFENNLRHFLRNGRPIDRIAAANLAGETMANARKQYELAREVSMSGKGGSQGTTSVPPKPAASSPFLRERLARLSQDLKRLTQDRDPEVCVAGVRALSDIEANPRITVEVFHAILKQRPQPDERVRRAAADALGHIMDIFSRQRANDQFAELRGTRLHSALDQLERVLPAAVVGLTDSDLTARRFSVEACQKVAAALHDLVTHQSPRSILTQFGPMMTAVQAALPVLGAVARGGEGAAANADVALLQGAVRRDACHVLETLVLATQQMDRYKRTGVPPPPDLEPPIDPGRDNKSKPLPSKNRRIQRSTGPLQWGAVKADPPPQTPVATLGRPVKLVVRPELHTTAFQAPKAVELPPPSPLGVNLRSTIDSMTKGLEDRDYRVRLAAIDVLETAGEAAEPAIPALVRALSDSNKFVRWAAARTLGKLHPRQAKTVVPGLVRLLNDREDLSVRITAALAIQRYGPDAKEAVPHLARVINRGNKEYIVAVIRALLGIGTDAQAALPSIAWILRERDLPSSVRVEAAKALGRFGPLAKGQLRVLREIMESDTDAEVRQAASNAVLAVDRPDVILK